MTTEAGRSGQNRLIGILHGLRRLFTGEDLAQRSSRAVLLVQFYATLRTSYLAAIHEPDPGSTRAEDDMRVRELLEEPPTWERAYEIEQKLVYVMSEDQVRTEWRRRLNEGVALNLPFATEIAPEPSAHDDLPLMRAHLLRLVNDLQWHYQQRILRRDAAKLLSERVAALFLSAFILFSLMLFLQIVGQHQIVAPNELNIAPEEEGQ